MRRFSIRAPEARTQGVVSARAIDAVLQNDSATVMAPEGALVSASDAVAQTDLVAPRLVRSDTTTQTDRATFRFFAFDQIEQNDLAALSVTGGGTVTTYPNGYKYNYRIGIAPQSATAHTLTNWVLWFDSSKLIDAASVMANLKSVANGGKVENGDHLDIRFEDTSGTQFDHEIETYEPTTGLLRCWVRIPEWDCSLKARVLMYFGKEGLEASEEDAAGVWAAALAAIDPVTGEDKSGKGRSFTPSTAPTEGTLIGKAGVYTVTSRLGVSNANWLDGLPTLAVEFWLQVASGGNGGSDRTIFRAGGTLSSGGTRRIVIRNDETADVGTATETLSFLTRHADGTERITCLATNLQDESRHHWVFSVTAGTHKIWRDSATLAASAQSGTATGNLQVLSDAATIGDPAAA